MRVFRSIFAAALAALSCGALTSAAPAKPASCQTESAPLIAMESAWGPREALRQQRLMNNALDLLKPSKPNKRDVFIVAAALGDDHVFDQEASGAAAILAQHYGKVSRVVVLSNGAKARGVERPAATPEHFSAALAKAGEAMNPDDVLFLFVTSHGTPDKGAAIYETKRLQSYLSPARLSAELDDAGIKNRVLIISACFAGMYIPALQNDDTAILTAARADRSSFGCQPERDWTYFGDALFANALSKGATLLDGFEQAKVLIQQWETEQNMTPSEPSQAVGVNAALFLADLEKRRPK